MGQLIVKPLSDEHALAVAKEETMRYDDLLSMVNTLASEGWTQTEEFRLLIAVARGAEKDATRLAAMKQLNQRRREIMVLHGMMQGARRDEPGLLTAEAIKDSLKGKSDDAEEEDDTSETTEEDRGTADSREVPGGDDTDVSEAGAGHADSGATLLHKPPSGKHLLAGLAGSVGRPAENRGTDGR